MAKPAVQGMARTRLAIAAAGSSAPVMPVKTPVTLKQSKADPLLQSMALVRQSRLSVCPVSGEEWARVCDLAGVGVPA